MRQITFILLLFLSAPFQSQNVVKVSDIYDFDIGDEFHYTTGSWDNTSSGGGSDGSGRVVVQIINKWHSPNLDSIYYVRKLRYESSYRIGGNHFSSFGEYVDTISFSMNDKLKNSVLCDIDSLYRPSLFNFSCIDTVYMDTSAWYMLYVDISERFVMGTFSLFAIGLGEVYDQYVTNNSGSTNLLEYYKKDTIECGTPLLHVGIQEVTSNEDIFIYPNPVSDKLHLSGLTMLNEDVALKIYNTQGAEERSVQSKFLNDIELDVSDLISGIYMIQLTRENSVLKSMKFIKK